MGKYGRLTIIKSIPNSNKVLCKCDCGTIKEINFNNIMNGRTKSCGCLRRETSKKTINSFVKLKDITGQRFGHLVAVKRLYTNNRKESVWLCQCDCGKTREVRLYLLTSGITTSCGCSRRPRKIKNKVA